MINIKELVNKHGSVITINTNNIKNNYKSLQALAKNAVVAPVIKSNAYGIGLNKIITILDEVNCSNYFVSTLEEGIVARNNSKHSNIYILHGIFGNNEAEFIKYNLTPVINSLAQLEKWFKFAENNNTKLNCIIHVDTGINRLGLQKNELDYLVLNYNKIINHLNILYIISHLACSDEADNLTNQNQYNLFLAITNKFSGIKRSIAASYAIYFNPEYHFDMVRPGFALYGSNPSPNKPNPLLPAVEYYSSIIKINQIKKGDKIGYTHAWTAREDSTVATITLGYADGILRSCSNQAYVFINDQKLPIIGKISMDSLMVDITNLKTQAVEGTIVEIIGKNQDIDQFATMNNTINCEVLNIIGNRYPRIYY